MVYWLAFLEQSEDSIELDISHDVLLTPVHGLYNTIAFLENLVFKIHIEFVSNLDISVIDQENDLSKVTFI